MTIRRVPLKTLLLAIVGLDIRMAPPLDPEREAVAQANLVAHAAVYLRSRRQR